MSIDKQKKYIKNYTLTELEDIIKSSDYDKFRAKQIFDEIYIKRTSSFENMTLISKDLRIFLSNNFILNDFLSYKLRKSEDGSIKILFKLLDGNSIEAVFMPWIDDETGETIRNTICISSMAGCPLDCSFCATASLGYKRKLNCSEMIAQIIETERITGEKLNNVVYMGMGEPLLNFENVVKSIRILSSEKNKIISQRKITISTSGIVDQIYKLADQDLRIKLAISLHSTDENTRSKIMNIASKKGKIKDLLKSIVYYYKKTKNKITYEYILFELLNDSQSDINRIVKICNQVPSTINIIPFNDISHIKKSKDSTIELVPASSEKIENFANALRDKGVNVNIRKSFGKDIEAACGQLALSDKTIIPV